MQGCVGPRGLHSCLLTLSGRGLQALFRRGQLKALVDIHSTAENMGGYLNNEEISVIRGALDLSSKQAAMAMTPLEKVTHCLQTGCPSAPQGPFIYARLSLQADKLWTDGLRDAGVHAADRHQAGQKHGAAYPEDGPQPGACACAGQQVQCLLMARCRLITAAAKAATLGASDACAGSDQLQSLPGLQCRSCAACALPSAQLPVMGVKPEHGDLINRKEIRGLVLVKELALLDPDNGLLVSQQSCHPSNSCLLISKVPLVRPWLLHRKEIRGLVLVKELALVDPDDGVLISQQRLRGLPALRADIPMYDLLKVRCMRSLPAVLAACLLQSKCAILLCKCLLVWHASGMPARPACAACLPCALTPCTTCSRCAAEESLPAM